MNLFPEFPDIHEIKISNEEYEKIEKLLKVIPVDEKQHMQYKKNIKKGHKGDKVREHFFELSKLIEELHTKLVKANSPYRFCVYIEGDDIFMDIVILDESGKIKEIKKRNITFEEFEKIIEEITAGHGLYFEAKG
ncbi:MAG: hypothetical protein ACD_79C00923G0002 [uncultured bacterium]|nr:MAG: hypothetical protein ACD_79C00923G0002 [uncultured bacterium]